MKKIICLVLALCMTACLFAGCGSDSSKDAESTASVAESKGTLTMGTNATFPPYEFVDDNGEVAGIDAEIAKAIADKLGMTLEIKDMEFDLGFNCLGMRSNNPVLPGLEEAFKDTETYVYTIGDSVRARRIMEGTMEGRAILNVLESQGYLHLEPLE